MNRLIQPGLVLVCIGTAGCSSTPTISDTQSKSSLEKFQAHLIGSFSSELQSLEDKDFYHIVLHMAPIWNQRDDGPWLYVEQAVAGSPDRPYRQRVYKLEHGDGTELVSRVYTFPYPDLFVGAWEFESALSSLGPDDLTERTGCEIRVQWDGDSYVGATTGKGCTSTLRGANYATSEVDLHIDRLITWDRGFDDAGNQVWGATKSGYIFDRIHP